jgi:hypothetical protein
MLTKNEMGMVIYWQGSCERKRKVVIMHSKGCCSYGYSIKRGIVLDVG